MRGADIDISKHPLVNYNAIQNHRHGVSLGSIGCSLSHTIVYEKIIAEAIDFAMVFEDDVLIDDHTIEAMKNVPALVQQNSVTMLYYNCWHEIVFKKSEGKALPFEDMRLYEANNKYSLLSAAAYVITNGACKTMLEKRVFFFINAKVSSFGSMATNLAEGNISDK